MQQVSPYDYMKESRRWISIAQSNEDIKADILKIMVSGKVATIDFDDFALTFDSEHKLVHSCGSYIFEMHNFFVPEETRYEVLESILRHDNWFNYYQENFPGELRFLTHVDA